METAADIKYNDAAAPVDRFATVPHCGPCETLTFKKQNHNNKNTNNEIIQIMINFCNIKKTIQLSIKCNNHTIQESTKKTCGTQKQQYKKLPKYIRTKHEQANVTRKIKKRKNINQATHIIIIIIIIIEIQKRKASHTHRTEPTP
jgi:hypothetical protein